VDDIRIVALLCFGFGFVMETPDAISKEAFAPALAIGGILFVVWSLVGLLRWLGRLAKARWGQNGG
jgi:hypothetical protein